MSRTREEIKNYFNERPELKKKIEEVKLKEFNKNNCRNPFWKGRFYVDFLIEDYELLLGTAIAEEMGEECLARGIVKHIKMVLSTSHSEELKEEGEKFWAWYLGEPILKHIIGYKGFNSDLTCHQFQYEVGKEYEIEGLIELCERGFHACERPLHVLRYYRDFDSRYCIVEQWGYVDKGEDKTASSNIKIVKEISLRELFETAAKTMTHIDDLNDCVINKPCGNIWCSKTKISLLGGDREIIVPGDKVRSEVNGTSNIIGVIGDKNNGSYIGGCNKIYFFGNSNKIVVNGNNNEINIPEGEDNEIIVAGDYNVIYVNGKANITCIGRTASVRAGIGSTINFINMDKSQHLIIDDENNKDKEEIWWIMTHVEKKRIEETTWR